MKNIFKLARLKLDEMLQDITTFTSDTYGQAQNVYSPASAWGQIILVLARIAHQIFYYIEDSVTELNINTATREQNVRSLIQLTGHNITRPVAAQGDVFVIPNGSIPNIQGQYVIIPNFTKLLCKNNGLSYLLVTNQTEYKVNILNDKNKIIAKVIQGELESQTFTGTGLVNQSFECNMSPGRDIDNAFVNVFVNGRKFKIYDSLLDIPNNGDGCLVKTGLTSGIDVFFGNNYFGTIPPLGSEIIIEYLVTSGSLGNVNVASDIQISFIDEGYDTFGNGVNLNDVFNIVINTPFSFGTDAEDLSLSRLIAPKHSRNFVLGTIDSFKIFFEKFQIFSTIKIWNDFQPFDFIVDNILYMLLIPDLSKRLRVGENYFSVPFTFFSLSEFEKYKITKMIEDSGQKMFTTILKFVDPQFKKYSINLFINTWKGYSKDSIYEDIISKLSDYFINFNRNDFLPKSDLIALIEAINGVDSVNLYFVSEKIETEIIKLINADSSQIISDYLNANETLLVKQYWLTTTNLQDRTDFLFQQLSFLKFININIDDNGDIIIGNNEIPIIRGGFKDRNNRYYDDIIDQNKLSSVNVNFIKENTQIKK